jgi:hypothetical protein
MQVQRRGSRTATRRTRSLVFLPCSPPVNAVRGDQGNSPTRSLVRRITRVIAGPTDAPEMRKTPWMRVVRTGGRGGFRTCDLSRVKQRGASALRTFIPGNPPNRMPRMVIGSSPIRPGTAAFGPTIGPTMESASCRLRVACSVNALAAIESVNRETRSRAHRDRWGRQPIRLLLGRVRPSPRR